MTGIASLPWVSLLQPWTTQAKAGEQIETLRTIRVGSGGDVLTLAKAAQIARDGDTVEVDPGDYRADVAVWTQRNLLIRGIGTRPRLIAEGASAESKGIFVVRADRVRIENLAFVGARVRDRNGAGIRLEAGHLEIAGCHFEDNENGILTGNSDGIDLAVDRCSFVANGSGDGMSHNLYAGAISRLAVSSSYFARARVGHLLKSRARETLLMYCRLSSEDGSSSYELEFPNGGLARVLACLIQQGSQSENATIVSYGAEGYRWQRNELQLTFNTIVNNRVSGGTFVRVATGSARAEIMSNLLVGSGGVEAGAHVTSLRNAIAQPDDFANATQMDYRLRAGSRHVGTAGKAGQLPIGSFYPEREYVHPADSQPLADITTLPSLSPGAFQGLAD